MTDRIEIAIENHIAVMTIKRPEKLNAFDIEMLQELSAACDRVEADSKVRVAILTGEGKAFSAGGDIKAWGSMEPAEFGHAWVRYGHRVFERLATLRVPLIAAMNGHALGGGLELAGAADIRIVEKQAKIGLPETSLGMIPGWSGTQRLVRRFGAQIVRRMVLGGEMFTAEEALSHGLVDHVVETGAALQAAQAGGQARTRRARNFQTDAVGRQWRGQRNRCRGAWFHPCRQDRRSEGRRALVQRKARSEF